MSLRRTFANIKTPYAIAAKGTVVHRVRVPDGKRGQRVVAKWKEGRVSFNVVRFACGYKADNVTKLLWRVPRGRRECQECQVPPEERRARIERYRRRYR